MLKYLHTALERFATKSPVSTSPVLHACGRHNRLAQVWNAIITTKYYDVMQVDTTSHEYQYG